MRKYILLAGVAASLAAMPSTALAQSTGGGDENDYSNFEIDYRNNIDTSVVTDVSYTKDLYLIGYVTVSGNIEVDSSAVAVNDTKQIMALNAVTFREENELNGENGYVDPIYGPGWSEAGLDPNDNLTDGVPESRIRVGFFAPVINNANAVSVTGEGNIGVNVASGWYNMQANSAVMAVATSSPNNDTDGGWAEASTTSLQKLLGNYYGAAGDPLEEDDEEQGGGGNNFRDRNTASVGSVSGAGNIGVNVAAGAFNMQQNLLTLAVASDSSLAEANAGIIQSALFNRVEAQDTINTAVAGPVSGAGNIGVNIAAGVGNMQSNSLTAAVSGAFGGGNGTGGNGGNGGSDPS